MKINSTSNLNPGLFSKCGGFGPNFKGLVVLAKVLCGCLGQDQMSTNNSVYPIPMNFEESLYNKY